MFAGLTGNVVGFCHTLAHLQFHNIFVCSLIELTWKESQTVTPPCSHDSHMVMTSLVTSSLDGQDFILFQLASTVESIIIKTINQNDICCCLLGLA